MSAATISRVALAFLAAPASAVATLVLLVFALSTLHGDNLNSPLQLALHFAIYGTAVIFPLSIAAGVPLYLIFKFKGWLTPRVVFIGAVALSMAYPAWIFLQNPPNSGLVSFMHYSVCAACGLVAAWVFCKISGITSEQRRAE